MSALSALRSIQIPNPINQVEHVDEIFTQFGYDNLRHLSFVKEWGVLEGKKVTDESVGNSSTVVATRSNYLVAKCFKNTMQTQAWREANTLCLLNIEEIPHVPRLYGVSPYIRKSVLILNYAGPDLIISYQNRSLQLEDISRIAKETLDCIQFLAAKGISHNDIKLENICYTRDLGTTLIDWEGASTAGEPQKMYKMTRSYQPPEAYLRLAYPTDSDRSKTDIWAVASVIFTLLSNDNLLVVWSETDFDVLDAIEQRLSPIPQEMINASTRKGTLFNKGVLRGIRKQRYISVVEAFEKEKENRKKFYYYNEEQYDKIGNLVLDLLKINPAERPSAETALKEHFPPPSPIQEISAQEEEPT